MLACDVAGQIRQLLAERQLSVREIARKVGVARGTVIASAEKRRAGLDIADDPIAPLGPPARCPICGVLVYPPCVACSLAQVPPAKRESVAEADATVEDDCVSLELKDAHRRRYDEIRARRSAAQEDHDEC